MSRGKLNVPILSLLDLTNDDNHYASRSTEGLPAAVPLLSLVSRFQTSIDGTLSQNNPIVIEDSDSMHDVITIEDDDKLGVSKPKRPILIRPNTNLPMLVPKPVLVRLVSPQPSNKGQSPLVISNDQIKQFQTSFQVLLPPVWNNKTLINSIINIDDASTLAPPEEKKKKPTPRKKDPTAAGPPAKKRKTAAEKSKESTPLVEGDKKKPAAKNGDKKPASKPKKRPTETPTPAVSTKPAVHPTMTTDKAPTKDLHLNLPAPSFIEKEEKKDEKTEEKSDGEKNDKKREPPIIALNIPLLDPANPKPGQCEVVVNVLQLAEEKYGWSAIHPNAKSAIDMMDDVIDDEDDAMDDDDDDIVVDDKALAPPAPATPQQKKKKEQELTEEQLVKQHEAKMNRKVGKYDFEDPFIDDEELQWEEEITSTKEGFFVYWGPLVDDRSVGAASAKKGGTKKK